MQNSKCKTKNEGLRGGAEGNGADSSGEVIAAILTALASGDYLKAKELAAIGAEQYPRDSELVRFAAILNPPRANRAASPPDVSVLDNQDWIVRNTEQFRGNWVALQNGELVASAETAGELKQKTGGRKGLFVTKVT
jgi:hypothetical protein